MTYGAASALTTAQPLNGPLLLDSADLDDVHRAAQLGYVSGVTTNPRLLAVAKRPPLDHIGKILHALPSGNVYHQLQAENLKPALDEARRAHALSPSRVVLKLHATPWHFELAAKLVAEAIIVAMTAVYSPAQYLLARTVGAAAVIPYVDRSARLEPHQDPVVRRLAEMRARTSEGPLIVAASIKSADQAAQAVADGADIVSASLDVLLALGEHPLSNSALDEFKVYQHRA